MAGLTQRKSAAIGSTSDTNGNSNNTKGDGTLSSSSTNNNDKDHRNGSSNGNHSMYTNGTTSVNDSSKTSVTTNSSTTTATNVPTAANSKGKSLKERSAIPVSFYITFGTILGLQYFGGLYDDTATLRSWYTSLYESILTLIQLVRYSQTILLSSSSSASTTTWREFGFVATLWGVVILPLVYVFFIAPFRAGFWTGRKSRRHVFHRYMGLCYLLHYVLAWIEFFTNPTSSKTSYLCHIIAVMGKVFILIDVCFVWLLHHFIAYFLRFY